jgi:hypothetical protein
MAVRAEEEKAAPPTAPGSTAVKGQGYLNALPEDTLFLLHVPNVKGLQEKAQRSPLYKLKDHPDLKSLVGRLEKHLEEGFAEAERELGFKPLDLLQSFEGEAAIALGNLDALAAELGQALAMGQQPSPSLDSLPLLIAGDAGKSSEKVRGFLEKIFAAAEKDGAKRSTHDVKGGKMTVLSAAGPEEKKAEGAEKAEAEGEGDGPKAGPPAVSLCVAEIGSHVLFSTSRKFLESCAGRVSAAGPGSLGSNALFQETRSTLRGGDDALVFVNMKQLTNTINNALKSTFFAFYWQKVEGLLFGKSFNALGVSVLLEDTGVREAIYCQNGGASDGILGIFKSDPFPPAPPGFLPDGTQNFTTTGFNPAQLEALLREVAQIAMAFQAPGGDIDAMFEQNFGVKLKDLFGAIGRRLHFFSGTPNFENPLEGVNLALDLKEEGPVKQILQKSAMTYPDTLKTSKYKEKEVFSLSDQPGGVAAAVSDKLFILTGKSKDLEAVVDRAGSGGASKLAAGEDYKKVAALLPPQVVQLSFATAEFMKSYATGISGVIDAMTKGEMDEDMKGIRAALAAAGDLAGPSVMYGVWKEKGLFLDSIYLYRQK